MDDQGFLFFRDRTGDTYRWRGENVSTSEVETTISGITKLGECVSYGVEVPGHEGRAGMIAILEDKENELDLQLLLKEMKNKLPAYSVPLFVRLISHVDYTPTFKLQKVELKKQAFNIDQMPDKVFVLNAKRDNYELLTKDTLNDIRQCNVRF